MKYIDSLDLGNTAARFLSCVGLEIGHSRSRRRCVLAIDDLCGDMNPTLQSSRLAVYSIVIQISGSDLCVRRGSVVPEGLMDFISRAGTDRRSQRGAIFLKYRAPRPEPLLPTVYWIEPWRVPFSSLSCPWPS